MCPDLEKTNCNPSGASGKESACQYRRQKRHSFDPWVRKIPWSREWQPSPIFLPGEFYGQRSLAGCSPWGHKELDLWVHVHTHTHTQLLSIQDSSVAHSSGWSDGKRRYKFFLADKLKLIDGERTGWSLGTVILDGIGLSVGLSGGTSFQWAFRKDTGMRFSWVSSQIESLLFQLSKLNGLASLIPRTTLLLFSH